MAFDRKFHIKNREVGIDMFNEWYRNPERIKEKFEERNEFENLKSKLVDEGIIFEGDCYGLVTSQLIEHGKSALEELFLFEDSLCSREKDNTRNYHVHTDFHLGWNYFLYDMGRLDFEEAYKMAEIQFKDYLE